MAVNKYGSLVWDGTTLCPIPTGDRYWSQDRNRDFQFMLDQMGAIGAGLGDSATGASTLIRGGVVSQGTGDTINITAALAICLWSNYVVNSYGASPRPSRTATDVLRLVVAAAQSNLAIASATLNGVTVNYVKLAYAETDGQTRARARATGSYVCEKVPSYTISVSSAAATAYEVVLATLVGSSGGAFTIVQYPAFGVPSVRGLLLLELVHKGVATLPSIGPGIVEIGNGSIVRNESERSVASFIGDGTKRADYWYYIMMNQAGTTRAQLAEGGYIGKTYSITSISGTNTINFSASAGGTQPVAGMIAVMENTTTEGNEGFWAIASVAGSPVTSLTVSGTLTNQAGAAGTVKVYYRMSTYHFGAGSEVGITATASVRNYTPSPADAFFATPVVRDWAWFDPARNGYYSKWKGYQGYRILGCVHADTTADLESLISYKSGRNKNDNIFETNTISDGTAVSSYVRFNNVAATARMWGNDYILSDDGTYAGEITALRVGRAKIHAAAYCSVNQTSKTARLLIYLQDVTRTWTVNLGEVQHVVGTLTSLVTSGSYGIGGFALMSTIANCKIRFSQATAGVSPTPYPTTTSFQFEVE
jgi:hypothetical protein